MHLITINGAMQNPAQQKLIPISVGSMSVNTSLILTPNYVKANPGDVLQFQFFLTNHTVTQSAGPANPCSPLQATVPGAIHSGFIPGAMLHGSDTVGAFDVMVQNTEPMYIYCAQGSHCQLGQVMVVNG
ncbi:putative extracellular serine-rich protein [Diaporthe ampelina]|uniref:Putative extracellular serine-rich protein n=1 Tax=Diaporthe ampelina TaxID=1214573 RepID=A0A0G2H431_9PEZI|nr:putative extracellular serine-rich protein [Diaporthe ampelina]